MKAIQLHIIGISKSFIALSKGKYLLFFIPGIVIALLFWQAFLFTNTVESSFSFLESIPFIGSYLLSGVEGTFSVLQFILNQVFVFFILTVLSPFNTILGEKIDTSITGTEYPFDIFRIINDVIRMIFIVIIALFLEFLTIGIYWIIARIFGFHILDDVIYFLIAAFFYGFSFYDYSLERDQIGVMGSLRFAFSNILKVTLTGCIFFLIYNIPIVGVIIAPVLTVMISTYVFILNKPTKLNSTAHDRT